jgi:hypothetical protein
MTEWRSNPPREQLDVADLKMHKRFLKMIGKSMSTIGVEPDQTKQNLCNCYPSLVGAMFPFLPKRKEHCILEWHSSRMLEIGEFGNFAELMNKKGCIYSQSRWTKEPLTYKQLWCSIDYPTGKKELLIKIHEKTTMAERKRMMREEYRMWDDQNVPALYKPRMEYERKKYGYFDIHSDWHLLHPPGAEVTFEPPKVLVPDHKEPKKKDDK